MTLHLTHLKNLRNEDGKIALVHQEEIASCDSMRDQKPVLLILQILQKLGNMCKAMSHT